MLYIELNPVNFCLALAIAHIGYILHLIFAWVTLFDPASSLLLGGLMRASMAPSELRLNTEIYGSNAKLRCSQLRRLYI